MKFSKVIVLSSCLLLINACNKNLEDPAPAAPIDQEKLNIAGQNLCPSGQKFQVYKNEIRIANDPMPNPVLFVFQKGDFRCASLSNVDHSGLVSWLSIDYSNSCLTNGSIWKTESLSTFDGNKVYFKLTPLDTDDTNWVRIFTSYGYSLKSMKQEIGLSVYSCAN